MTDRPTSTDRACWVVLCTALLAAAALILWLDRATTYNVDQIRFFMDAPEFDLEGLFEPQNGNLLLTTTLAYKLLLGSFGADFLPFRIIHVVVVVILAALFYALIKRRIGPVAALAPTLVLLFFGSDWGHVATALGFTVLSSIACGLGALLLLERDNRIGDLGACALLVASVASFSTGLAFLVGVGISVMIRSDRWARAWIWALPLASYLGWWLWARGADSPSQDPELWNLLLAPDYAFTSLAAVLASLTGLNYDFPPQIPPNLISVGPGKVLAIAAIGLLAMRIVRGRVPGAVWVGLGIVLTYWTLGALVVEPGEGFRDPTKTRYMYAGAVMVLLVATAAVAGVGPSRWALIVLFAVAGTGVAANLVLMCDGATWFRDQYSASARTQFAMLDLARDRVPANFDPRLFGGTESVVSTPAGSYLAASEQFGSPGFTLAELARQPEDVRAGADRILTDALALGLEPSSTRGRTPGRCRRIPSAGGSIDVELVSGNASIRMRSASGGAASAGRFAAQPTAEIGELSPGVAATLHVPADPSSTPWHVQVATPEPLEICGDLARLGV